MSRSILDVIDERLDQVLNHLKNYKVNDKTGCWEFADLTSGKGKHRYGVFFFSIGGIKYKLRAHRAQWALAHRKDPGDLFICHKCDNTLCINPDHLFIGTPADNMQDMAAKGRSSKKPQKGSKNGASKITETDLDLIVVLLPVLNNKQISARLNGRISHSMVSRIRLGKSWSDYTGIEAKATAA